MSASKIIAFAEVAALLQQRFPEISERPRRWWETGWAALDANEGAIPLGAIAEVCSSAASGRLFLARMLAAAGRKREWAGLIEAGRSLDFHSYYGIGWKRTLSVFCQNSEQAVKAADLLLRDGNLVLVLLDLQMATRRSLERIPANTWHRFQRLVERNGTALVVLTSQPLVEAARVRIALHGRWDLAALRRPRDELLAEMEVQVFHRGRATQPIGEPLIRTA